METPLPAAGDTSWMDWATELHETVGGLEGATVTFNERVDDRVAALLVAGANVTLTYDDTAGTLTIAAATGSGGGLTQEQAEDIVAALIDDNSDLDWTYVDNADAAGSLVAVIKPLAVTNAMLAGSIALTKLVTDPLARGNHTGAQAIATVTGLQAALDAKAARVFTKRSVTGAYTLVAADATDVVLHSTASTAVTITLPADTTATIPQEVAIPWRQYGTGQITFAAGTGATLVSRGSVFKAAGQHAEGVLTKVAADTWLLSGDISA